MERAVDLRGLATVAGARLERVVERPHEVRVYLDRSLWLHFWPAAETSLHVPRPELAATDLTEEGDRTRLRADGELILEAKAPNASWHPYDDGDVTAWKLDAAERAAVEEAVRATIDRDLPAVRAMGGDEHWWTWADEHFAGTEEWLASPPGPFEDWELGGFRMDFGTEITVELFDTAGRETDLTLRLTLIRDDDGPRVELDDLHAL